MGQMIQNTRAVQIAKTALCILALLLAALLEFVSTRLLQTDPLKDLLHDTAIAIPIALVGTLLTTLVRHLFISHAAETSKISRITGLWHKFGIANMAAHWADLVSPTAAGLEFRNNLKSFEQDSLWYIVTITPEGFMSGGFFNQVILPAVEHGAKVKWSYMRLPEEEERDTEKILCDWWDSQYSATWSMERERALRQARINLSNNLGEIERHALELTASKTIPSDSIEIYESQVPITFLALLAVKRPRNVPLAKLTRRFGGETPGIVLVYPYIMYPLPHPVPRWGMVLTNPGELYEQYARSIVRFFDEGEKRGTLRRVWP